jgi:hypothetical protein
MEEAKALQGVAGGRRGMVTGRQLDRLAGVTK